MGKLVEFVELIELPDFPELDLPEEDDEPLESDWHRLQINLLVDIVRQHWQGRTDFFVSGNMFVYFSLEQARNRDYKGPDFFVVKNVDGSRERRKWEAWNEGGRYPNVIVELMSPSTASIDLGSKWELYAATFRTPEYFCYDPLARRLYAWRLGNGHYTPMQADENDRFWSTQLEAWVGVADSEYLGLRTIWLRLFDHDGSLLPTTAEAARQEADQAQRRAQAELRRAEAERQRADSELRRADTEQKRADKEQKRADKEQQQAERERQQAEKERQQAEKERQQAEKERLRAEAEAQRAETERQRADTAEAEIARLRAELAQGKA